MTCMGCGFLRIPEDPLAIPFSMGCNLLCIYSKKYIDIPPERKLHKQLHNKKTMELMAKMLKEGGYAIYVAPSGGRDRRNDKGSIEIAPFDPQSIEMFYLMAKKSKKPTHFFTLTLHTYDVLPPPETTEKDVGESRLTQGGAVHLDFGPEVDMETFPGYEKARDKHDLRKLRAHYLWNLVQKSYTRFPDV